MFREQLNPALKKRHCLEITVFTQGGASPLIVKLIKKLLQDTFVANRVKSRGLKNPWPPRSSDLNLCDFYVWGKQKDKVYGAQHVSVVELKSSITRHVRCVKIEILNAAVDHAILRFKHVVASGSSHIEHIVRQFH